MNHVKYIFRIRRHGPVRLTFSVVCLGVILCIPAMRIQPQASSEDKREVRVVDRPSRGVLRERYAPDSLHVLLTYENKAPRRLSFYIKNLAPDNLDVTIHFNLNNMKSSASLPIHRIIPPGPIEILLTQISPENGSREYSYNLNYRLYQGDPSAKNTGTYRFPFESGNSFQITNGFFGARAHKDKHAVDLPMPAGTRITAARGGLVASVKEDSGVGGPEPSFIGKGNYVRILHEDGTYGTYAHFRLNGVQVEPGQRVQAGDFLGYSGNTGYSTGPHLHFEIKRANGQGGFTTLPWKFTGPNGKSFTPETGMTLRH